jgi:nucleotide-binding universal stress UspA family protein
MRCSASRQAESGAGSWHGVALERAHGAAAAIAVGSRIVAVPEDRRMLARLLCPVSGAPGDRRGLDAAATIATAFASHVEVLHARPDPAAFVPYLGEGMSAGAVEALIADAEGRAREAEARARAAFDAWSRAHGLALRDAPGDPRTASCAWRSEEGAEDAWIARRGKLADLVVIAAQGAEASVAAAVAVEAALIDTGRPVLLAPAPPLARSGRSFVAWNGSQQAARAIGAALPFLARASTVDVATIEETDRAADPADLVDYLSWHGIAAAARRIPRGTDSVAATLERAVTASGADLLVMGAYTHSRLRELVFGGVTAHVLRACRIPTLLAH